MHVARNLRFGLQFQQFSRVHRAHHLAVDDHVVGMHRTHHARVAEAFGVKAWQVSDPADLESALKAALMHDGPALVDVISQELPDTAVPVSQWMG